MNILNTRELQQIGLNHSSDIETKHFTKLHRKYTTQLYSFLAIDTTLLSDNALHFQKNILEEV